MKKYITIILFFGLILVLDVIFLMTPDKEISESERRYLEKRPTLSFETLENGTYPDDLETYLLDQFPFRETFRKLHSFLSFDVFQKIENNDIIIYEDTAIKLEMDYNYDAVSTTIAKLNTLKNTYFSENPCYFALIPDKACYLSDSLYPSIDYEHVFQMLDADLENIQTISLKEHLTLADYYRTDSHWNQINISKISDLLKETMGNTVPTPDYKIEEIPDFYGVYDSQAALNMAPDTLSYYTNDMLSACTVYHYDTEQTKDIYDLEKLSDEKSLDMYDIFLSGSKPLLKVENPSSASEKTLIVFRDSFGSSLTPLLADAYSEILVIDLRYIHMDYVLNYIEINPDADVLFLYSTLITSMPQHFRID